MSKYKLIVTKEQDASFTKEVPMNEVISQEAKLAMYNYAESECQNLDDGTYIFELYCEQNGTSEPANGAPMFSYTVRNGVASLNEKRFTLENL